MPKYGIMIPGAGPGTGPMIGPALYSYGVGGVKHRYVADRIPQGTGQVVQSWSDQGPGGTDLAAQTSVTNFVVAQHSGHKVLQKLGGNQDALIAPGAAPLSSAGTMIAAIVIDEGNTLGAVNKAAIRAFGIEIGHAQNSTWQAAWGAPRTTIAGGDHAWAFVAYSFNGSSPIKPGDFIFKVNGNEKSTLDAGTEIVQRAQGGDLTLSQFSSAPFKVAELAMFDRALSSTEMATVRASMRAQYGFLP